MTGSEARESSAFELNAFGRLACRTWPPAAQNFGEIGRQDTVLVMSKYNRLNLL
jgi:hypothetical protein